MELDKFRFLEEQVNSLIERFGFLVEENLRLKGDLAIKTNEVHRIKERLERYGDEREYVKGKVDGLIKRLDGLIENV